MNILRVFLRLCDIFWITAIIILAIRNSYIGINNHEIIAPITATLFGVVTFMSMLILNQAHQFNPATTYAQHLKTVLLSAFGALGIWLTLALITKPELSCPMR